MQLQNPIWSFLEQTSWIDLTSLSVLAVFAALGLVRGLVWQVTRLLALLVGYVVASTWSEDLAAWMRTALPFEAMSDDPLAVYVAYFLIFLGVLIAFAILAGVLRKLLAGAGLTLADRLGGGVFGVLTGAAILLLLLTVPVTFFAGGSLDDAVRASTSGRVAHRIVDALHSRMPTAIVVAWNPASAEPGAPADASWERQPLDTSGIR